MKEDPALVVMPTGSGKTAVLMLLPFMIQAKRVLILTPSKLVRNQIAVDFEELNTLKKLNVIDADQPTPSVHRVPGEIRSKGQWDDLYKYDVVVSTPNSCSPYYKNIPNPPNDLFDLVVFDEAHHASAKSWMAILDSFDTKHKALFTATPYRRDRKELPGHIVFNYSMREAIADKVYGKLTYHPIKQRSKDGHDNDILIAKATEKAYEKDKKDGFDHSVMVRADTRTRANELSEIYSKHTNLKLNVVRGDMSEKTVDKAISSMRSGKIDGVICVNMMGEGFDYPRLKIAALHHPHKSLNVTLQFVGRFARVNDVKLGDAKFFAIPQEIAGESKRLFEEDSVWTELVPDLSAQRIEKEQEHRRVIMDLGDDLIEHPELQSISLFSFRPKYHARVYRVGKHLDFKDQPQLPRTHQVVMHRSGKNEHFAVTLSHTKEKQLWCDSPVVSANDFELTLLCYIKKSRLFFICNTPGLRSASAYTEIAQSYAGEDYQPLPMYELERILNDLSNVKCQSIGMRNRMARTKSETYRIVSGSSAEKSLTPIHGRQFHRGHIDCSATEKGEPVTLGYSSGSKIWSKSSGTLAGHLAWFKKLSTKMMSNASKPKIKGLEYISSGEPLKNIKYEPFAVEWDEPAFRDTAELKVNGTKVAIPTSDLQTKVISFHKQTHSIEFEISYGELRSVFKFKPGTGQLIQNVSDQLKATILEKQSRSSLLNYLNTNPPTFYLQNFSTIRGMEYFPNHQGVEPLDENTLQVFDWMAYGADIEQEEPAALMTDKSRGSIHEAILALLLEDDDNKVIIYDHRSYEIADFLAIHTSGGQSTLKIYHCKKSKSATPGARVDDIYDLAGQVVKTVSKISDMPTLVARIDDRIQGGSMLFRGDIKMIKQHLLQINKNALKIQIYAVQPGISKAGLGVQHKDILASTNAYLEYSPAESCIVYCST
jgi:hypothetical protein